MTVVRIAIKKILLEKAFSYRQVAKSDFSSEYLVQTDAPFPSPQLEAYALGIAQAESRLYPACVGFKRARVNLATPGASAQELHGQFSLIGLRAC